jgi:hypothetical protein
MPLQCHLPGQIIMVLGAGTLSRCRKLCIQADLYSSAWIRSGGSMLPADFILLTNSCHSCVIFQTRLLWSWVLAHCHVAGNCASRLICIVVPGSAQEGQCCLQTFFC